MGKANLGRAPRLTVHVTQEIIDRAMRRNSNHCMVADALRIASKDKLQYRAVDIQTTRGTNLEKGERYIWLTPPKVQRMIVDFDRGEEIKPFSFELQAGHTIPAGKPKSKKRAKTQAAKKARPKFRRAYKGSKQSIPEAINSPTPPRSIGARRAFGLRSIER